MNVHALQENGPHSCATCARADCHLSFISRQIEPVAERTAYVLDEIWPEYRDFVGKQARADDQLLAPGLGLSRYGWPGAQKRALWATGLRHLSMRRVVRARGGVRQAAYAQADERLAGIFGRSLDYRARHVVVYQTFLPYLWRDGWLGGRSFDVLMTRYPLAELHARLDTAQGTAQSRSLSDYRAPDVLVAAETEALAAARRIITPHHDIAEHFIDRALWLDWHRPVSKPPREGTRTAFLGPVIARQGADVARTWAKKLDKPLIVFGTDLEGPDFWQDAPIERRAFTANWLDDIGTILHPAVVTHQPRRLIEARAHGVEILAHASCGLAPGQFTPLL